MVGGDRDDNRFGTHSGRQFGFDKIADFARAFADQADDDDIAVEAGEHLPHQHRFADARSGDDRNALPFANGQQAVDRAHADVDRADDTAAVKRIGLAARPAANGRGRQAGAGRQAARHAHR